MRGLERLTYARLGELLTARLRISAKAVEGVLAKAEGLGIPFPEALLREGFVSEVALAALVAEEFNLPLLPVGAVQPDREALASLPGDFLLRHLLVPLDRFGGSLTVSMPALAPAPILQEAKERSGLDIFPGVGFPGENRRFLEDLFKPPSLEVEESGDGRPPAPRARR